MTFLRRWLRRKTPIARSTVQPTPAEGPEPCGRGGNTFPLVGLTVRKPSESVDEGYLVASDLDPALCAFRAKSELVPVARVDWLATFQRSGFEPRDYPEQGFMQRPNGDVAHLFKSRGGVRNPALLTFIEPGVGDVWSGRVEPLREPGLHGDVVVGVHKAQALRVVPTVRPLWLEHHRRRYAQLLAGKCEILARWADVSPLELLLTAPADANWLVTLQTQWRDDEHMLAVGGVPRSIHSDPLLSPAGSSRLVVPNWL